MFGRSWSPKVARQEMARLISPGILGFYTHFEATEVFAKLPGDETPVNIFTILVAASPAGWPQRSGEGTGEHVYRINGRPITQGPRLKAGYSDDLFN